jgi:hypothetical protein
MAYQRYSASPPSNFIDDKDGKPVGINEYTVIVGRVAHWYPNNKDFPVNGVTLIYVKARRQTPLDLR